MTQCTICGSTSRDGAKFCTSCGARLEDDAPASQQDSESNESESSLAQDDPERESVADTYASSWPATDTDAEGDDHDDEDQSEPTPISMSFATDKEQDPEPDKHDEGTIDDGDNASEDIDANGGQEDSDAEADMNTGTGDHEGASNWESWSPDPGPLASVQRDDGEGQIDAITRLVDELQQQVRQLKTETAPDSGLPDGDEFVDQLERWSSSSLDIESLLAAVRQVRKQPRDLDAISALTDNIADLELLVRHYQSITTQAGEWAAALGRSSDH